MAPAAPLGPRAAAQERRARAGAPHPQGPTSAGRQAARRHLARGLGQRAEAEPLLRGQEAPWQRGTCCTSPGRGGWAHDK
eukprot:6552667-Alexandrium_andersonii.AAC.1